MTMHPSDLALERLLAGEPDEFVFTESPPADAPSDGDSPPPAA